MNFRSRRGILKGVSRCFGKGCVSLHDSVILLKAEEESYLIDRILPQAKGKVIVGVRVNMSMGLKIYSIGLQVLALG